MLLKGTNSPSVPYQALSAADAIALMWLRYSVSNAVAFSQAYLAAVFQLYLEICNAAPIIPMFFHSNKSQI